MTAELVRFIDAQEGIYERAVAEIESGRKRSHWMWFIFPQAYGLGSSEKSKLYGIRGLDEARAYLAHPMLGSRLEKATESVLHSEEHPKKIFGDLDYLKFVSCMTLFSDVAAPDSVFERMRRRLMETRDA